MNEKSADFVRSTLTRISPKLNAKFVFRVKKHKPLNWNNPQTLAEKLVKLRIENYNDNPLVKQCADKYAVREYVKEHGYEDLLNDLVAVYDRPEDIEWDALPDRFALKLNFANGYNVICTDKNGIDRQAVEQKLNIWSKQKPWLGYAELQYKDVPIKVIVEKFLEGKDGLFPEDYKIYCFNGEPKVILYMSGRYSGTMRVGFFDVKWNHIGKPNKQYKGFEDHDLPQRPESLETMLKAAADLSKPFPFVRVDFYDLDGQAIFGEMTFSPAGGFDVADIEYEGHSSLGYLLNI